MNEVIGFVGSALQQLKPLDGMGRRDRVGVKMC